MVRLKKGLASLYWEDLVLAIIGEQFDVGSEICGAVVSIRGTEDIISVWNKSADNSEATGKIRDQMRRILKLPTFVPMEYKKHHDSLTDKSSFRNTVVWRAPPGRLERGGEGQFGRSTFKQKDGNYSGGPQRSTTGGGTGYIVGLARDKSAGEPRHPKPSWNMKQATAEAGESALPAGASWGKYHREDGTPFPSSGWSRGRGVDAEGPASDLAYAPRGLTRPCLLPFL